MRSNLFLSLLKTRSGGKGSNVLIIIRNVSDFDFRQQVISVVYKTTLSTKDCQLSVF